MLTCYRQKVYSCKGYLYLNATEQHRFINVVIGAAIPNDESRLYYDDYQVFHVVVLQRV